VGLKLNGTDQPLAYADDVNLLGDNMHAVNKNTQTLIDTSKEVGLEVTAEKTKCQLVSRRQNEGQNRYMKLINRSSKQIKCFSKFNYLLFMCRANSHKANYRQSTEQIYITT
jgi:hypothetical protein